MIQIPDSLVNELISNPVFKTDTRAIFFLLQNQEPVSSDDIAAATGLSRKCANKATKRLTAAGLIQPGQFQAKKRTFDVTGWEPVEPQADTEGTIKESLETLAEKVGRLESVIGSLTTALEVVLNPASSYDGQNMATAAPIQATANLDSTIDGNGQDTKVTQAMTIPAHIEPSGDIQAGMMPGSDPKESKAVSLGIEQIITGTEPDTIVSDLDDAIKYAGARLAAVKAASLLKEKANSSFLDTCAPARAEDTFRELFGVQVPVGFTDTAAVETMVRRKKAGKLDNVKSPLGYLASLAGKVSPITSKSTELNTEIRMPFQQTPGISSSVNARFSHADMARIDSIWDAMDHSQYKEKALAKDQTGKKYPVPIELLARSIFNAEMMAAQGGQYGKGN